MISEFTVRSIGAAALALAVLLAAPAARAAGNPNEVATLCPTDEYKTRKLKDCFSTMGEVYQYRYPYCPGQGWAGPDGSTKYALIYGLQLKWDTASNKLFVVTGSYADHTTWNWFSVPTSKAEWDNTTQDPPPTTPPAQRPSDVTIGGGGPHCINGTKGDDKNPGPFQACVDGWMKFYRECAPQPVAGAPAGTTPGSSTAPQPNGGYAPPECTPETQTAQPGQPVVFTATGGDGAYAWDISGDGVVATGGNERIEIIWRVAGLKSVLVTSGGRTDRCTVQVGQLPVATAGAVTAVDSGGGLPTSTGVIQSVTTVTPATPATAASNVSTGPDDALILALLIASASALLYTGYTRSPAFRRRELENIGRKNEPTDFRS